MVKLCHINRSGPVFLRHSVLLLPGQAYYPIFPKVKMSKLSIIRIKPAASDCWSSWILDALFINSFRLETMRSGNYAQPNSTAISSWVRRCALRVKTELMLHIKPAASDCWSSWILDALFINSFRLETMRSGNYAQPNSTAISSWVHHCALRVKTGLMLHISESWPVVFGSEKLSMLTCLRTEHKLVGHSFVSHSDNKILYHNTYCQH